MHSPDHWICRENVWTWPVAYAAVCTHLAITYYSQRAVSCLVFFYFIIISLFFSYFPKLGHLEPYFLFYICSKSFIVYFDIFLLFSAIYCLKNVLIYMCIFTKECIILIIFNVINYIFYLFILKNCLATLSHIFFVLIFF